MTLRKIDENMIDDKFTKKVKDLETTATSLESSLADKANHSQVANLNERFGDVVQSADLDPNKDIELVDARHGEKTLGSKIEFIDKQLENLGARAVKLENIITNGDFELNTNGWTNTSGTANITGGSIVPNGKVSLNALKIAAPSVSSALQPLVYDIGDVIYFHVWSKVLNAETRPSLALGVSASTVIAEHEIPLGRPLDVWGSHSLRKVMDVGDIKIILRVTRVAGLPPIDCMFDGAIAINLTKSYGQGKEPTKDEMDTLLRKEANSWFDGIKNIGLPKVESSNKGVNPSVLDYGVLNDGETDFTQAFQNAVNVLGSNNTIVIPKGIYLKKTSAGIKLPSNFKVQLEDGAILKLDSSLLTESTFFINSDKVNGNENISIIGGRIDCGWRGGADDEFRTVANFERVNSGKVDSWITNYNFLECKRKESNVDLINRMFLMPDDTPAFDCESVIGPGGVNTGGELSTGNVVGSACLTVQGSTESVFNFQSEAIVPAFLKEKPISFTYWMKFDDVTKVEDFYPLQWMAAGSMAGNHFLKIFESGKWYHLQSFTYLRPSSTAMKVGVKNKDPLNPCRVWIDDIRIVRSPMEPAVSMSFDDAVPNRFDAAPGLAKYGGKADWGLDITNAKIMDKNLFDLAYHQYGWNLISHSYSHAWLGIVEPDEVVRELVDSKLWLEENGYPRGAGSFFFPYHSSSGFSNRVARKVYRNVRHPIQAGLYAPCFQGDRPQTIYEFTTGELHGKLKSFMRRHIWVEGMTHVHATEAVALAEKLYEWGVKITTSKEVVDAYEKEFPNLSKYGDPKSVTKLLGY